MLEASGVTVTFGKKYALTNFDIFVKKNTVHALVGPNGSGKSTVIRMFSGEVKPSSGTATVNGISVTDVKKVQPMVSVVQHISRIPDKKTGRQLIEGEGKACRLPREEIGYRVEVLAETLEMTDYLDTRVGELSRGFKRRVSLGMALIKDSPVLLMDGSLAELDPAFSVRFMDTIHELGDKTVLLTANNVNLVDRVCDGVTIIKDGTTLLNESMLSIREKIGRPGITFRVGMMNLNKFENAMRQQIFVNRVHSKGDSVTVEVDDMLRVPGLVRYAAGIADIFEVRQSMTTLEDLYHSFFETQGL